MQQVQHQAVMVTQASPSRRGAVEGTVIINGQPQMERMDMPGISFESIQALMNCAKKV